MFLSYSAQLEKSYIIYKTVQKASMLKSYKNYEV